MHQEDHGHIVVKGFFHYVSYSVFFRVFACISFLVAVLEPFHLFVRTSMFLFHAHALVLKILLRSIPISYFSRLLHLFFGAGTPLFYHYIETVE